MEMRTLSLDKQPGPGPWGVGGVWRVGCGLMGTSVWRCGHSLDKPPCPGGGGGTRAVIFSVATAAERLG